MPRFFVYESERFGLAKSLEAHQSACMTREPNQAGLKAICVLRQMYRFDKDAAAAIGCTSRQFQYWYERGGWITPNCCNKVAELTGVPTYELRSDVFSEVEPATERLRARIDELEAENSRLQRIQYQVSELVAA